MQQHALPKALLCSQQCCIAVVSVQCVHIDDTTGAASVSLAQSDLCCDGSGSNAVDGSSTGSKALMSLYKQR